MRGTHIVILGLLGATTPAVAQEARRPTTFEAVARLARVQSVETLLRDLQPYCFPALDARAQGIITEAVRSFDSRGNPESVYAYARQHPCATSTSRSSRPTAQGPGTNIPSPTAPPSPAVIEQVTTSLASSYVTGENRCAISSQATSERDLRIPRQVQYLYVFLQTPGPAETAESHRLAAGMPKDEFVKCFEAFREAARSQNMRLIVTATDGQHRSWYQPAIRFRNANLRPVMYKSPDEERTFPGAEVPLN